MPSLINELVFEEVRSLVESQSSIIVIDAAGLKSSDSLALRRQLFGVGAVMRVAKASVMKKAVPGALAEKLAGNGSLAVIGAEDIAAVAKIINGLAKEAKVVVRGGMVEGKAVDGAGAGRFADLPTKQEARALFVRALKAPYCRMARALKKHSDNLGEG